ncbi:MAG TPA: cobalamin B12-binding domain-containing protein [Burkholderiales bacterium]|nr:cobalamin B12-binding domain-containing protein [Burkholderiales bacterium]
MVEPLKQEAGFGISAVERDTGLSKDTLRIWERRYGFPLPARDHYGERLYLPKDVEKLRLLKRLLDRGHRPGRLMAMDVKELAALAVPSAEAREAEAPAAHVAEFLERLKAHDAQGLRNYLSQALARQGLQRFVDETVAPLNAAIGEGWERGGIEVYEEHLYTEQVQRILRSAILGLPAPRPEPSILLTTLPGEQHGLGLLMAEAVLSVEGANCVCLGVEVPVPDIAQAALRHGAHVVGLSFSMAFPVTGVAEGLQNLRTLLPPTVALWAGGRGVAHVKRRVPGVELVSGLRSLIARYQAWAAPQGQ